MGIYIKGMEMPTNDELLYIKIYSNGKVAIDMDLECKQIATAVPVPPHGDLIERKTAYDSLLNGMVMTGYQSMALDCISDFYVPTIIPASEEG